MATRPFRPKASGGLRVLITGSPFAGEDQRQSPSSSSIQDAPYAGTVGYLVMPSRSPRDGFHSVTPRIVVEDVEAQVNFLRAVFGATGSVEPDRPAEIRIGNSLVMVSGAVERDRFQGFLYVYVDDADSLLARIAHLERELAGGAGGDLVRANWFLAVSEDPIRLPR